MIINGGGGGGVEEEGQGDHWPAVSHTNTQSTEQTHHWSDLRQMLVGR